MTIEDYYAAVGRLGVPSRVPTVYVDRVNQTAFNVPDPTDMTPEQRQETIERIKRILGR